MSAAASADASSDAAANYFLKNIRKHSKCWEKGYTNLEPPPPLPPNCCLFAKQPE